VRAPLPKPVPEPVPISIVTRFICSSYMTSIVTGFICCSCVTSWKVDVAGKSCASIHVFAGWFLGCFELAGAGLFWEENTVDWLNKHSWNQQANMMNVSMTIQLVQIGNPFQIKIYKFPRHWTSSRRILLLILLLLIRGPNRDTTLILTRYTKKKNKS